jgi:hypothetical protein
MTTDKTPREEVRQRALTAILTDAFFTWPSAITIGLTIIAFFSQWQLFAGWQPWYWLIAGALLEVIYLVTTLTDPAARQQAVSRMLTEQFDPRDIKNISARQRLQKALEYKKSIDEFVAKQTSALKVSLAETAHEIDEWIALIYRLARSIDNFESNAIIERDRRSVPTELQSLERRLRIETDPGVKAELQKAIEIRRSLLEDLQKVESQVKRTEIQMDSTVAQLSTVHAKLQLIDAKELDSGRAQRLQQEIHEEVASLNDMVSAMDDVYSRGNYADAVQNLGTDSSDSATTSSASGAESPAAQRGQQGKN